MAILSYFVALVCSGSIFMIIRLLTTPRPYQNSRFPPGPRPNFLIGNILHIPPFHPWLKFKEWSDIYGPIFRFSIFGTYHYVVSTEKVANDLLRDRGAYYSSREELPSLALLLCGGEAPVFLPMDPRKPKSETWKRDRKFYHQILGPSEMPQYTQTHDIESTRLVLDLIQTPQNYQAHFERYATAVIVRLSYGKRVETGDEEYVTKALDFVRWLEKAGEPGAYLVDAFPWLMRLPSVLAPFKRELGAVGESCLKYNLQLQNEVREEMRAGCAPESFTRKFLEMQADLGLNDVEGAWAIGGLYIAGAATTSATLLSLLLALVLHPEWLKKMQEEIDRVVGAQRLPNFADLPELPITRAAVKETLRWRPVTAGGLPHKTIKDDVYEGFFVPDGTNIHPNLWAIQHDPKLYPSPSVFNPDRWLLPGYPTYREPLSKFPNLTSFSAFGFGRRICPGLYLAERSLNIAAARIVWACNVHKRRDINGREINVPEYDYTKGFNAQPNPFEFELCTRSKDRVIIIEASVLKGKREDPLYN